MNSSELLSYSTKHAVRRKERTLSSWQGFSREGTTVECHAKNGSLAVSFVTETIVRVRVWLGDYQERRETGIVRLAEIQVPGLALAVSEQAGTEGTKSLKIAGSRITVLVDQSNFTVRVLLDGRELASDTAPVSWNRQSFTLRHRLDGEESVYGLGEKTGYLDKRGKTYHMWNSDVFSAHTATTDPLYVSIPFFVRLGNGIACGFYLDNSWRTSFDLGETDPLETSISAPGGNLDYYLIGGADLGSILPQYAALTGSSAMPPRWAIGHHQSRYSYKTADEVREIAAGFVDRKLACASIHLDIHYMDGNRTFTWDEDAFHDPDDMSAELLEKGIRLTAIVDPAIKADPEYEIYREMVAGGFQCRYADGKPYVGKVWPGECVFPDFVRADVRAWWGEKVVDFMNRYGIEGIWHDMNEPAVFNAESTMDVTVCHGTEPMDSHARYHNLYAYYECMASHDAIRAARGKRPFILTRAGFSGIQKYAAVWTGDNRSMWEHLELSLPMLLNMGLSGIQFVGADIGGFSYNAGPELLARWYQLGMFYPFARNHCAEHARRQEPWSFGEPTEGIVTAAMRLRERLLPDFYTSFRLASTEARPVMRPLVWDYPDDPALRHIYDQFLFGDGLMGAPILRPGMRVRQVYLPEGVWYGFHDGERLEGGRWILAEAPLDRMPLFVRAGSTLVSDEGIAGELTVTVWVDDAVAGGSWAIYSDDGLGYGHETGEYAMDRIEWKREGDGLVFSGSLEGNPDFRNHRTIRLELRNAKGYRPALVDGVSVTGEVSPPRAVAHIPAGFGRVEFRRG